MKTLLSLTGILCLTCTLLFAQQTVNIDTKNSVLNWTGHAEIGNYAPAGTLNFKEGRISIKNGQVAGALLLADMKSMQQSNANLLGHLKSDDFFDVEKYPVTIIKINRISDGKAFGELMVKGKAQPLVCPVTIRSVNGKTIITGSLVVDRTKFGIIYNSGNFFSGLGDKAIRNTFDVAFSVITE